jgi:inner membrane transporter RhtA
MPAVPLLIALGICTSVIPFALNGIALRDLSAGTVAALGIMEPLSATIYSVVFFSEPMDVWKVLGVVIILSAVAFLGVDEILAEKRADKLEKKKPSEELSLAD